MRCGAAQRGRPGASGRRESVWRRNAIRPSGDHDGLSSAGSVVSRSGPPAPTCFVDVGIVLLRSVPGEGDVVAVGREGRVANDAGKRGQGNRAESWRGVRALPRLPRENAAASTTGRITSAPRPRRQGRRRALVLPGRAGLMSPPRQIVEHDLQIGHRLSVAPRALRRHRRNGPLHVGVSSRAPTGWRRRFVVEDLGERRDRRLAGERTLARDHLVEHRAKAEDVGARVIFPAVGLLRRHVRGRADDEARLR